jgi:hypothetical protein
MKTGISFSRIAISIFGFSILLFFAPRVAPVGAERARLATARALANGHGWDLGVDGPETDTIVHRGARYGVQPPGGALAMVPPMLLERALAPKAAWAQQLLVTAWSALFAALTCALLFGGIRRLGGSTGAAMGAALALAIATPLLADGRTADGSALAALLLYGALCASRAETLAGDATAAVCAAALTACEPSAFLAVVVLLAGGAVRRHAPSLLGWLAAPVIAGVLVAVHRAHIGAWPTDRGDFAEGLLGLLLSSGKSVFLYAPPLALLFWALPWWWRTRRSEASLTGAVLLAFVLATAWLKDWHGDPTWGPRRLIPLLPLCAEPIALWADAQWAQSRRRLRASLLALIAAGALVQSLAISIPTSSWLGALDQLRNGTGAPGWFVPPSEAHFIPEFSPLAGHAWLIKHRLRKDANYAADAPWHVLVASTPKLELDLRPDWWAVDAPRLPAAVTLGVCAALAAFALVLCLRALRDTL